jgi:hypothetical protein
MEAGGDLRQEGDSMSNRALRRSMTFGLTLCLCLLPLTSANAAPRNDRAKGSNITIGDTIQQLGRTLLQSIGSFMSLSRTTAAPPPPPPPPGIGDGIGIDPNGGFKP